MGGGDVGCGVNYTICESLLYHVCHDISVVVPKRAVMWGLFRVCHEQRVCLCHDQRAN